MKNQSELQKKARKRNWNLFMLKGARSLLHVILNDVGHVLDIEHLYCLCRKI